STVRNCTRGDTVEAVVLAVDPERERISLGVKQLEQDPMGTFVASNSRGSIVTGTVKEVDARGAIIDRGDGVEGYLSVRDISHERVEDPTHKLKAGDRSEAKIVAADPKSRQSRLSIKAKAAAESREAMAEYNKAAAEASSGTTKLGALLREQLEGKSE